MSIVVYWTQKSSSEMFPDMSEPNARTFTADRFDEALTFCNEKRNEEGCHHVCLCSENPNSIGKPGVDAVENGLTPDGQPYTWMKRRTQ